MSRLVSTLERKPDESDSLSEELKRVLDVGESAIAHQFQVAERLDAKARGLVALAGAWFAVTQAVAGVAYSSKPGTVWLVLLLIATLAGGLALVATFFFCYRVWTPRVEQELTHSGFRQLVDEALERDPALIDELVNFYQRVIGYRRQNNKDRVKNLKHAQKAWWVAVSLTFSELIFALLTRVVG